MGQIQRFSPPPTFRSSLISNPPAAVPSLEDLLSLEEELKTLQTRTDKRVKKAEADIKILDAARRKSKDKERDPKASFKREPSASLKRECRGSPDIEELLPNSRVGSQPRSFPPPPPPPPKPKMWVL